MKALAVVMFLDGRPGHEKQTNAVIRALAEKTNLHIRYKYVHPSFKEGLKAWTEYLLLAFTAKERKTGTVDLIIGTGSYTHIPMIIFKNKFGGKTVTCMTPDFLVKNKIDLCFVPRHDNVKSSRNIFETTGPPGKALFEPKHDVKKGLILIGGIDRKSHIWDSEKTLSQIKTIIQKEPDMTWTISSSRRTPDSMIPLLEDLEAGNRQVKFFTQDKTPEQWIEKAYSENKIVWITGDSVSMIYEALTAGCSVGILPVQWKKKRNKFQNSIDYLAETGRVIAYEMWLEGKQLESPAMLDEASNCAMEILRRWWPEKLQ
jgi:mitochondrial fission protein ELM1